MNQRYHNSPRTLGLDPVVAFSLAGAILFFLISGAVAYFNLQSLRDDNQKIVHSHEVIRALHGLLSSTQDAETGQRGFLLTNNERYLEPYTAAVANIPQRLDDITRLTSDNPTQQAGIAYLRLHEAAKLAELKRTIELRLTQGLEPALAVVNSDRGKVEMDAIRARLTTMNEEETSLRAKRLAQMSDAYETAVGSGLLSGLLGIMLTAAIGFLLRRRLSHAVARNGFNPPTLDWRPL